MTIRFCDISNLGKLRISGQSAHDFMHTMFCSNLGAIRNVGGVAPSLLLNAEAEIIDLVLLIRTGGNEYMVTTGADNSDEVFAWLEAHAEISDEQGKIFDGLEISDESDALADIVLFGSGSRSVINELSGYHLDDSPHQGAIRMVQLDTVPILLLRTPVLEKCSDEAYEMFCPPKSKAGVINALMSFPEIDPMEYEEYVELRRSLGTWQDVLEGAAYVHPNEADLMRLVRPEMDFVGAKALGGRIK